MRGTTTLRQLAPVLWSAGDLLTGGKLDKIKRCANPECGWLFLDDSRASEPPLVLDVILRQPRQRRGATIIAAASSRSAVAALTPAPPLAAARTTEYGGRLTSSSPLAG